MPDLTERRYPPPAAATFLTERGFPVSVSTLNKLRVTGQGPEFEFWGSKVTYPESGLLDWAASKLSKRVRSTSEPVNRHPLRPNPKAA